MNFQFIARLALFLFVLALGGLSFLLGQSPAKVHWSDLRVVAIESDDWGLAGFSPNLEAWSGIDREELAPGNFPPVYWNSTLEDSAVVLSLHRLFSRVKGADGLPAVFQPNYVLGSQSWSESMGSGKWREHAFPAVPGQYQRPGLVQAVRSAISAGVWYPELHARWHYDPDIRHQAALSTPVARLATARGITLFPGSEKARELGPWRSRAALEKELSESLSIFQDFFGRRPGSIIAPDYTWNSRMESIWESQGLRVIQAKREQRNPELGGGMPARVRKFLGRRWAAVRYPGRVYLERNVRLEPVQAPDPEEIIKQALEDTRRSWDANQPAIVETHRVNYAHLDPRVEAAGLMALERFLMGLTGDPESLPLFLTDHEIAQLQARGVAWAKRGELLIIRNATRSARIVNIGSMDSEGHQGARTHHDPTLVLVPAMSTLVR